MCTNEPVDTMVFRAIHLHAARRALDLSRHNQNGGDYKVLFHDHYRATLIKMLANSECTKYLAKDRLFGQSMWDGAVELPRDN